MKTVEQLLSDKWGSGPEMERRAKSLKRIRGLLSAEIKGASSMGLTHEEVDALTKACEVLGECASRFEAAGKRATQSSASFNRLWDEIMQSMTRTFGAMSSDADKVSVIAFSERGLGKDGSCLTLVRMPDRRSLDYWYQEALTALAYRCAKRIEGAESRTKVLESTWQLFCSSRGSYEGEYAMLIACLSERSGDF